MTKTIFINMPSYKDPEIWLTIEDFIKKAKYPKNVYFGVTHQTDLRVVETQFLNQHDKTRVQVNLAVPGSIVGAQPGRLNSHKFYNGQDYYLNMDSHMRAIPHWDVKIIKEFNEVEKRRGPSMFTGYVNTYDRKGNTDIYDEQLPTPTFYMSEENIAHFKQQGIPQFCPRYTHLGRETHSSYVSGHFFFTRGEYIDRVPFVEKIVFTEEEIFMALRMFTAGYNIFIPKTNFVFHRYGRPDRKLIWDEFPELWYPKADASKEHALKIIENNIIDKKEGLFPDRTLAEFEEYSGIQFVSRELDPAVISHGVVNP